MSVTSIEWTATPRADGTMAPGYTFNPWRGCTKVSPGCTNCYAETLSHRNPKVLGTWGKDGTRPIGTDAYWRQPLAWNRAAAKAGERRRVFCASLADVFEDREDLVEPRRRLFDLIGLTPWLDWLLLTKRPENARTLLPLHAGRVHGEQLKAGGAVPTRAYLDNVWLGTTVEDQARADERIPHLLAVPAAVRFLSVEPLLGPVHLNPEALGERRLDRCSGCVGDEREFDCPGHDFGGIDWVIVGGESGGGARPCDVAWIRDVVAQCRAAGVPVFVKQLGALPRIDGGTLTVEGYRWVSDHKGGDPDEWPADLRVREFPAVAERAS